MSRRAAASRGGRPTRDEARRRQKHLLEVAGAMFMQLGYDGTSIEAVAESAGMSKRTLYARYPDKGALFSAVLRELIARWLVPINQFKCTSVGLEPMLVEIGRHLLTSALAPQAVSLHRIIVSESGRQPEFGRLANTEGRQAGIRAIAAALECYRSELRLTDVELCAEQFLSLVIDSSLSRAALGTAPREVDVDERVRASVELFLNGVRRRERLAHVNWPPKMGPAA